MLLLQQILYAYKTTRPYQVEQQETFSLKEINYVTLKTFEDKLDISAHEEGRLVEKAKKGVKVGKKKHNNKIKADKEVYWGEEKDIDIILNEALDWIEEDQEINLVDGIEEEAQNTPTNNDGPKDNTTDSTGSWGQFFIKPSEGQKDKMWIDSQCYLHGFLPLQLQVDKTMGWSEIPAMENSDETLKYNEDTCEKNNEEQIVSNLDMQFKAFEESFKKTPVIPKRCSSEISYE